MYCLEEAPASDTSLVAVCDTITSNVDIWTENRTERSTAKQSNAEEPLHQCELIQKLKTNPCAAAQTLRTRPSGPGCQDQTVRTRPALEVLYRMFGPSLTCMRVAAEVCQLLVCYRDFLRQVLRQVLYPSHSVTWSGMFTRPTLPLSTFIMHSPDVILY